MRTSYSEKDVILLLKDITGQVAPQSTEERERLIQLGRHYCEMLPMEYRPTAKYMEAYERGLQVFAKDTANAIGALADKLARRRELTLVSLARAGIPVGILLKRYLQRKYGRDVPHYAISIIRGRGIDKNAMAYLLGRHSRESLLFVDGWTGKGAIFGQLQEAMKAYPGVSPELAVAADPANLTELCGTHEDILIPSSCLNSTVSGLVSRTFLRGDIIGPGDFHGAVYYGELKGEDQSYGFIEAIEAQFQMENQPPKALGPRTGLEQVANISRDFHIDDVNLIKPGIGEATRVLLRRKPWKVLIDERAASDGAVAHILQLAEEKNVPVELYQMDCYKACGIIKKLADT